MITPPAQAVFQIGGPVVPVAKPAPAKKGKLPGQTVALLTAGAR
jgi:hypothetical protein